MTIELYVKSLKEGRNRGYDLFVRKLSIKSLLVRHVLEPILKVGCKFGDLLFPPLKLSENFKI